MKLKTLYVYDKAKLDKLIIRTAIEELVINCDLYETVSEARRKIIKKAKLKYR